MTQTIYTYVSVHVGKYTIHGWYRMGMNSDFSCSNNEITMSIKSEAIFCEPQPLRPLAAHYFAEQWIITCRYTLPKRD